MKVRGRQEEGKFKCGGKRTSEKDVIYLFSKPSISCLPGLQVG